MTTQRVGPRLDPKTNRLLAALEPADAATKDRGGEPVETSLELYQMRAWTPCISH